jgi:hypothetical protein
MWELTPATDLGDQANAADAQYTVREYPGAIGRASEQAPGRGDRPAFFTQMSRGIDQQLWFVESHIPPQ